MKKAMLAMMAVLLVALSPATTVEWWDFEDGTAGATFYSMPSRGSLGLVNNKVMRGWSDTGGPSYSAETHSGTGLSAYTTSSQDGYTTDTALNTWSPLEWTIEISFRVTSSYSSTYRTIIGRDGWSEVDGVRINNDATFYFQRRGSGSGNYALRLEFATAGGKRYECLSTFIPELTKWYHAALVSDGLKVGMYIDSLDGNGYQLVKSIDMDPANDNRLLIPNNGSGGVWTFGRGWWNGNNTDNMAGYMDDVRFSEAALTPSQFLHAKSGAWNVVPRDGQQNYGYTPDGQIVSALLSWNTGLDPNDPEQINPAILMHSLYLSKDQHVSNDANLYVIADIPVTGPTAEHTLTGLNYDGLYMWRVDEAIDNGSGVPYPKNDPNNLIGIVRQFGSLLSVPVITAEPVSQIVDPGQTVVFNVQAQSVTPAQYQWYKSVDNVRDIENDQPIGPASLTGPLELANVNVPEEAYYYCLIVNDGGMDTAVYSRVVRLVIRRHVAHLPMDDIEDGVSPDVVGMYAMTLLNDLKPENLATTVAGVDELGGGSVLFTNTTPTDPNFFGQYGILPAGVVSYEDLTLSLWVYWNGGGNWQRIVDFGNNTNQYMFLTANSGSNLRFAVKNGGDEQVLNTSTLAANQWVHIAITLKGNTGRLYVNGELVATNTGMTINPVDFNPQLNYIGKSQYSADPFFNGMIDDLKIYNYALTTEQIGLDYLDIRGEWVCNKELTALPHDFNGNCMVDLADFAIFAQQWLESNRIYPNQ
jgi:hypothetical protein